MIRVDNALEAISPKNIFLSLYLLTAYWLFVFDCYFQTFGAGASQVIAFIMLLLLSRKIQIEDSELETYKYHLTTWLILLLFAFMRDILSPTFDYFPSLIKIFLIWIDALMFIHIFKSLYGLRVMPFWIIFTAIIQSVSPLIYYLSPLYRELVETLHSPSPILRYISIDNVFSLRDSYLSGSGYFGIAVYMGMASIITSIYYCNKQISLYSFILGYSLTSCAGAIAGRTSILLSAIALIIIPSYKSGRKIGIIIPIALIFSSISLLLENLPSNFTSIFDWMFEAYNSEKLGGESGQALSTMYFLPDISTSVYGDGEYYTAGGFYYGDIDAGYMRDILFGGIPFLVLLIISQYIFLNAIKDKRTQIIIFMTLLLVHIKGVVLLGAPITMALAFVFSYSFKPTKLTKAI